jgi:hypothetical protein
MGKEKGEGEWKNRIMGVTMRYVCLVGLLVLNTGFGVGISSGSMIDVCCFVDLVQYPTFKALRCLDGHNSPKTIYLRKLELYHFSKG